MTSREFGKEVLCFVNRDFEGCRFSACVRSDGSCSFWAGEDFLDSQKSLGDLPEAYAERLARIAEMRGIWRTRITEMGGAWKGRAGPTGVAKLWESILDEARKMSVAAVVMDS